MDRKQRRRFSDIACVLVLQSCPNTEISTKWAEPRQGPLVPSNVQRFLDVLERAGWGEAQTLPCETASGRLQAKVRIKTVYILEN